ncbi:hypothetical protein BSPA14S_H0043 (plasmid) [Borreliella spielmanii A14S]|uniref:Uncharacterized protein n=1 Tax=Borreliella spielmanii A14S TaxID=498742 RepID=C0RCG9_9SPIR|nr:hypothetical protein BSPA14S_H0043 [Borreliella spielmanii A14S]
MFSYYNFKLANLPSVTIASEPILLLYCRILIKKSLEQLVFTYQVNNNLIRLMLLQTPTKTLIYAPSPPYC